MDDQNLDFSFRSVRRRLHRDPGPPAKLQFQELQFVEDVVLVYGGWADGVTEPSEPELLASLESFKLRQVESLHVKGMDYISRRLQRAGNLLVCLESGLPSEPSPSIGFITSQWFSACVSQKGVEEVRQGKLERTAPGSLAEIISLLALLDFLTVTPSSTGFGSTASRILTLKVREGGAECVAHVEVRAVFGAPDIEAARHTAVIQLFQGKDPKDAERSLLQMLQSLRPQDPDLESELQEAVQLLSAAASCLTAPEVSADLAGLLRELGIDWDEWRKAFSESHEDASVALEPLGFELYRCAVCNLLECFSALAGFYAGESKGLDPVKASLTVLETCAAPSQWARDPLKRPEPSDEMCSTHAGCVAALRCHILQEVIDRRFSRLYGGPFKVQSGPDEDPRCERRWQQLFEIVDKNGNGRVEMSEWQKALENEDNEELRQLFQFDQRQMRRLAKKLFESVHEEADSWVDLEEFRKACRMAEKSELLWHYTYMMAGREAEKADDRPPDQDFAGLINWNRHCLELGLTQEDAHLKKYKGISLEKQLADSKFQAWRRHCSFILGSSEDEEELSSPGKDTTEEVLSRNFDSQLFIKIAFNTSKSFEDVALFGQLAVLQSHILEKIWEVLFPKYLPEATGIEQCVNLQLGVHYIIPREVAGTDHGVYFSLEGLEKWKAHLRDQRMLQEDLEATAVTLPPVVDDFEAASCPDAVSEATRSVSSSRIAPPSDATILNGAKVLIEENFMSPGGDLDEHDEQFRTRLPSSISQTMAAPFTIDSFAPFHQMRPPMTLLDLHPSGLDFQTIQAPRPDSLGSAAAASPMSWTSSDVVHQPLTPQAKTSRRKSSESERSLPPRAGAGPMPPVPAEESMLARPLLLSDLVPEAEAGAAASPAPSLPEAPVQWPEATVAASDSLEASIAAASQQSAGEAAESASGTEESGESLETESQASDVVQGRLAVELHAEFRRRPRANGRRRSSSTEDSSGKRFMQILETALAEKCGFRPLQIKFKTLEYVENEDKVPGGWNVTLWIYSLKTSMNRDTVAKHVHSLLQNYEEWAGERRSIGDDLFGKYAWAWCKFKAGKDRPYEECKPSLTASTPVGPRQSNSSSARAFGQLQETVTQDLRMAPAPVLQDHSVVCDGLIQVHCDVIDKQGLLIHSIGGIRGDFQAALVAATGLPCQDVQVQAMRSTVSRDREVVALKAALTPKSIALPRLRSIHKLMLNFIGAPSSALFFQKFEAVGGMPGVPAMHVSTSCLENEAGMMATTLVGSQTHSHIVARVDVVDSSERTAPALFRCLVENFTSKLNLPSGHVRIDNVCMVKPKRRRIFLNIQPKDGATLEEMRALQWNLSALDVPSADFVHQSLVIETALCHAFSDDTGSSTQLCCHLDVSDEHGCIGQNGGPRYVADFVQIFESLALRFSSRRMELRHLRIWPGEEGEYTIDFQVPVQSASDIRMAQQILWSLHTQETADLIQTDDRFQFFRALRILRPVRTSASKLLRDDYSVGNLQPTLCHQSLWAEIDVVDRLGSFSCSGGGPFAANMADFIHIVTGVESARLTVLGVKEMSRMDPCRSDRLQKHYNLKIEVDISDCVRQSEDLQELCESLGSLHRSSIQRRWQDSVPILKQYFIIGAACTPHVPAYLPRIAAHLDLICKDAASKEQGVAWRGRVAKTFIEAVTEVCGLRADQIVVTCIQKRRTSGQHAFCVSGLNEKMAKMELEKKAVSDTDEPTKEDEQGLQGLKNGSAQNSSTGCTIHFEVKPIGLQSELKQLASSLRKLHSQAVRRRYAMLPFFEQFEFDLGVQMQHSSASTPGVDQASEQYILPRRIGTGSPVLLGPPNVPSQEDPDHFVVFQGHANIIQRGAAPAQYGPCFEKQISGWFLEAWQYHLEKSKLEVQRTEPFGQSMTVRLPDSCGSLDFDGLLLQIIGVRLREAQTEKVQVGALKPEEVGFEAARVTDGFKAYAVDFEVLRLADWRPHESSKHERLTEQVQMALHGSLLQLAFKPSLKRDLKFYRHFEFDRGIQIDDISQGGGSAGSKTHRSTTPRTLDVSVRFHASNSPVSVVEVKQRMEELLGLEGQLQILGLDTFGELWEAKIMIQTLSHAPAVEETEAIVAKLQYLHRCGGNSSRLHSLGGWKLVAVISNFTDKEMPDEFQVLCTFQRSVQSQGHAVEELLHELAQKLGFNPHRLQIADVRKVEGGSLIKLQILGFSRKRAEMLRDFLTGQQHLAETMLDVKVVAAADAPVAAGQIWTQDVMRCATPMHSASSNGSRSLKELMEEYVGRPGRPAEKPYHFSLLKQIEDILRKLPDTGAPEALKIALGQQEIALPLLLQFGQTLMQVVEVHGRAQEIVPENIKEYFLSQEWQPEELRYALRVLAFVLAWDTRGTNGPQIRPVDVQAHFASFVGVLVKVMEVYGRFLVKLDASDLRRGLYRPCNVLQSLQALLLGIESGPSDESAPAWLAGTNFLESLSKLLLENHCQSYSYVHGHAVALLFPQATQMTCKAFSAKHHVFSQRDAICKNVLKLMRAIVNWLEINGAPNSPNWSQSLEESILKMSLPQFTWLLDRLNLPRTRACDVLGKLREWTELDLFHILDRSSLPPVPPDRCRSEHGKDEAEKSSRKVPLTTS